MANGPTLPPQAYTREMLTAAFNWLQTQPESVKKLAATPDALVGLFMRAQRYGHSSLEQDAPVSSQNFMSDLKNLAEGLKQFDGPRDRRPAMAAEPAPSFAPHTAAPNAQPNTHSTHQSAHHTSQSSSHQVSMNGSANGLLGNNGSQTMNTGMNGSMVVRPEMVAAAFGATGFGAQNFGLQNPSLPASAGLNERSQQMIQEVKAYFNLSSDTEAINMMVALAYKNLKNLLG